MNDLIKFDFQGNQVRTILIEGDPWWVAKDVCEILGYKDPTTAVRNHCKGVQKQHPLETTGGIQNLRIINEPDLYRLIIGSNLPEAESFVSCMDCLLIFLRSQERFFPHQTAAYSHAA